MGGTIYSLNNATFEVVPRTHYAEVLLSSTMIADHFPQMYTKSLMDVVNPPEQESIWSQVTAKKVVGLLVAGFVLYQLRKRWK